MEEKKDDETSKKWEEQWSHHAPFAPIVATILTVIGWLVFILAYALFWSNGFSLFQNVIVTIVSLVIMGLLVGLGWVVWGMRHARSWGQWGRWDRQ
jgi:cation transporter-like permease